MAWNHKCVDPGRVRLNGAWEDTGTGKCQRCGTERRVYRPLARPDLFVCAPCSQIYGALSFAESERPGCDEQEAA